MKTTQHSARSNSRPRWLCGLSLGLSLALLAGCSSLPGEKPTVSATPAPTATAVKAPSVIYVTDFYLPPEMIQEAKTLREQAGLGDGPATRLRQDLRILRGDDPESEARRLIKALSQTITDSLNKGGYTAEYRPSATGLRPDFFPSDIVLPSQGWLLGGWFERVQDPNRVEEAAIGFGAGSGEVSIEVVVSNLANDPRQPFLFIGTESARHRMPGGMVAMNPYAVAAKFVLTHGETERDVKAMGQAISRSIVQYIQQGPAAR